MKVSVVLANLMDAHGRLNNETAERIDFAAASESVEKSCFFLLCGWAYRRDSDIAIADAMREYIRSRHPWLISRVVCQRISRDTVGDALFARIYLDRLMVDNHYSLKVFTSDYHAARTSIIFNFFFHNHAPVSVASAPGFGSKKLQARESKSLNAFRNTFQGVSPGDTNCALEILRMKHPFYNGQVYDALEDIDEAHSTLLSDVDSQ